MQAEKANGYINNWKKCDIASLVNHFHFIDGEDSSSQYQRIHSLGMEIEKLKASLIQDDVKSMAIHMGLTRARSKPEKLSFKPIFAVTNAKGEENFNGFSKVGNELSHGIVPTPFKEALSQNWLSTEQTMIDDLFVAVVADKEAPQLQRLHSYKISGQINELLFKVLTDKGIVEKMKGLYFHLGADMNKQADRYAFTFSPIIEVVTEALNDEELLRIAKLGLRSSISLSENEDDSIFIEYLKPCPSTCNE